MAEPEHALQVSIKKWVRTHVASPHFFESVDRSKPAGRWTHLREKSRGVVAGSPDTRLMVPGFPLVTVELKRPGQEPSGQQHAVGGAIVAAGGIYAWCTSVVGYAGILERAGIPLIGPWQAMAQHYDAVLLAHAIKREERRTGQMSLARKRAQPTRAKLRKIERLRAQGIEP